MNVREATPFSDHEVLRVLIWGMAVMLAAATVGFTVGSWVLHLPQDLAPLPPSSHVGLPLLLANFVPYVGFFKLARIANARGAEEIASATVGLAYGGQAWISVVALTLPTSDTQALDWLRGHAWDYLVS